MNILTYYFDKYRTKVLDSLEKHLDKKSIIKASKDPHSKRRPRPCGLTIHTGVGCPYQCIYCYIYSMGFPKYIRRYPLEPYELAYAIALNKNVVLGEYGTFLALGSVTEPFHPLTREYTIELINVLRRYLGNPIQASTKDFMDKKSVDKLYNASYKMSILYTIPTIRWSQIIEPYAPDPVKRFMTINYMIRKGLHVTLFIRPFIPGVTDAEADDLFRMAREHGMDKVIVGTLRVNIDILSRIESTSKELYNCIKPYLPGKIDRVQRNIKSHIIKKYIIDKALEYGFKVFPSACSATIDAYGQACSMCGYGPCGEYRSLPNISEDDIKDFIEYLGYKPLDVEIGGWSINISIKRKGKGIGGYELNYLKIVSRRSLSVTLL